MTEAQATIDKAEQYISEMAMKAFDLTGQFEDSLYDVLEPYSNLTNFTGSPYADYLLTKKDPTEEDVRNAMDLIRLSEDQFVHWDYPADSLGFKDRVTPCVNEQYMFEVPIDASTAVIQVPIFCPKSTNTALENGIRPDTASACKIPTDADED